MKLLLVFTALTAALLLSAPAGAREPRESDFFVDTIDSVTGSVDIVDDFGANGGDNGDDSRALQNAIDAMNALPGGGRVRIPAGTFRLANVRIRSNVHVEVDTNAVLVSTGENRSMFWIGGERRRSTILERAQNCSIRGVGGRWTADLRGLNPGQNYTVIRCFNARNFLVADLNCVDNFTDNSAIVLTVGDFDNQFFAPRDGVVRNCTQTNGHPGFGLVQMQVGTNIFYKDLSGGQGVTLRMESGAARQNHNFNIDRVFARDISNTDGTATLTLNPHARFNGSVDARRITSFGSRFTIYTVPGFDDTPGRYGNVTIADVHAVYGTNAPSAVRFHRFIPCELRGLIRPGNFPNDAFLTPSAVAVLHTAADGGRNGQGEYPIDFQNVTQEGFDFQPKTIITDADAVTNCPSANVAALASSNQPPAFQRRRMVGRRGRINREYDGSIAGLAADPEGDPLTFAKLSGPAWLTIASDGKLGGTPARSDKGKNLFSVEVSDSEGGKAIARMRINVRR